MLRPRLRVPPAGRLLRRPQCQRSIHFAPTLGKFKDDRHVPGLLSEQGYAIAWTEYMDHLNEQLTRITAETEFSDKTPLHIAKSVAREPSNAALFNYASMVHNNHFFFQGLSNLRKVYEAEAQEKKNAAELASPETASAEPQGQEFEPVDNETRMSASFRRTLEAKFSSIDTLRREIQATAMSMFGPGFVWLVKYPTSAELRILVTYLAGSPYMSAHWRRQGVDMNTSAHHPETASQFLGRSQTGAGGDNAGEFNSSKHYSPGGSDVVPLLCLNTWEHVWLADYGIKGKADYVNAWWHTIDWTHVEYLYGRQDKLKT
ncbi:Manganese/iron superoxide dismutase [Xylariaceae sp. FL0255]|nr:Manganese/iron superoxide dismutase [Xylariaceae sp. FL0255]